MKRSSLIALLIAQSVLLFVVAWAGVYFARDEFLQATGRHDDDDDEGLAKATALTEEHGVPTVRLSVAAQRNVGIEVALPDAAELGREAPVPVTVLDVQPLTELHGRLRAARHEAEAARALASASTAERQRVQGLFDDDRNASQRALEAAIAQAGADAARERGAQASLAALRAGARAQWGDELARELEAEGRGLIGRLASGREHLLRASLRAEDSPASDARLLVQAPGGAEPMLAMPLGAAGPLAPGAETGRARSLLFKAVGRGLAPGQALSGQFQDRRGTRQPGVLVPASAVIWHAGQPWIYIRETNEPQAVSPEPAGHAAAGTLSVQPAAAQAKLDADEDDEPPRAATSAKAGVTPVVPGASASAAGVTPTLGLFQRRAVPHARRVGERWFLPAYAEDDPVVVRGAQLLLSEELKFQIRNENDD